VTATGEKTPFLGKCNLTINVGSHRLEQEILMANIKQNGILELDFLRKHFVDITLNKNCLNVGGQEIQCVRFYDGTRSD